MFADRPVVHVKFNFAEPLHAFQVIKKRFSFEDVITFELSLAYSKKLPLSQKKQAHPRKMIKKIFIPEKHLQAYMDLLS